MNQKIESDTYTDVAISREDGSRVFSVTLTDEGPRSCGGQLMATLGNGERVEIFDPLRFLDEIWTHGHLQGLRDKAAE